MNVDAQRRRAGTRRLPFQYAKDLSFLRQHVNVSEDIVDEDEDNESEREITGENADSKTLQPLKGDAKLQAMPVDEKKPAKKQGAALQETKNKSPDFDNIEERKSAEREKGKKKKEPIDFSWDEEDDELNSEDEEAPPTSPVSTAQDTGKPTFFIKQTGEDNRLIIRKKNLYASGSRDPLEEGMDDSADESGGTGSDSLSGRRPRRTVRATGVGGVKQLPVKKAATEQRLTRQQRHKSMGVAAARSSTSPVKLTPVPKYMSNRNQARSQNIDVVNKGLAKAFALTRDDIFPRPKAPAPTPASSQSQPQSQPQTQTQSQPGRIISRRSSTFATASTLTKRQVNKPANMNIPVSSPTPISQSSGSAKAPPPISIPVSVSLPFQAPPKATPVSTPSSAASSCISNNALLLTSSLPSSVTVTTLLAPSTSAVSSSGPVSASPLLTIAGAGGGTTNVPSFMTLRSRTERGMQTESLDIFSDEHFLEMVRPQMAEMNPRQKLHFKKKVFQSLMETFDDATDFPAAGEQQHFNINTPSGFEHISDREMRLVRELVSLVSAAKHSGAITKPPPLPVVPDTLRPVVRAAAPPAVAVGQSRHLIQRVYKQSNGMSLVASPEEKKIYRIVHTNGKPPGAGVGVGIGVSVPAEELRKNSVDSNCSGTSISRAAPAPPASPRRGTAVAAIRPQGTSTMNTFFGPNQPQVVPAKSGPLIKVREMPRRFSVCGSGGPIMTLGPPSGTTNVTSLSPQQNLSPMEAQMLKRRLMGAPAPGNVPPNQRPRYSGSATAGPGSGAAAAPHANSMLLKKSAGSVPGSQKQPSPPGGASAPQRTPQITSVQGNAFNDFVQPKPASLSGGSSSPLKRSLVVANAKKSVPGQRIAMADVLADPQEQEERRAHQAKEYTETAATIAADDFSVLGGGMGLKREPQDSMEEDADDILGM
ncbi:flocculation protein FLO11 isoform X2 [Drosophila obscura]|nr:flocculation protein FLO11 isoform X2 [Drosophila obscura]